MTVDSTESTACQRAGLALDLLERHDLKWVDHAWFVYYHWPHGLDPALRGFLRDVLGKLQLCHTGEVEDPAVDQCRSVMLVVTELRAESSAGGQESAAMIPLPRDEP